MAQGLVTQVNAATYPKVILYNFPVPIHRVQRLPAAIVRLATPNLKSNRSIEQLANNQQHTQMEKLWQSFYQGFDKIS